MKKFTPTAAMVAAAENVFLAMAFERTVAEIVVPYKKEILAEGQWHIKPQFRGRFGGEVILDPKQSYLMEEADFAVFDAKCKQARDKANLKVDQDDQCPLLVAENLVRQAEHALVEAVFELTGLSSDKLLNAGLDKHKAYVELTLRLLAPFVQNTASEILTNLVNSYAKPVKAE